METLTTNSNFADCDERRRTDEILALVVVWCREAPDPQAERAAPASSRSTAAKLALLRGELDRAEQGFALVAAQATLLICGR